MTRIGYNAVRGDDGMLTIKNVPIFVECKRGKVEFDTEWIEAAVEKAKLAERDGYFPPLHVRHHEPSTDATNAVRAAGYFRITRTSRISFKGERLLAVMADLVITDASVREDVLAKRLPYRSVEIFNVDKPAFDSLALLDHEAPFLELPMLMVSDVAEHQEPVTQGVIPGTDGGTLHHIDTTIPGMGGLVSVAFATTSNPWQSSSFCKSSAGVVACFRRGPSAHLLFQETAMDDDTKTPDETQPETDVVDTESAAFAKDEDFKPKPEAPPEAPGGPDAGEEEGEGVPDDATDGDEAGDVMAIVQAIQDGSISIAGMDAICAAVEQRKAANPQQQQQPQMPQDPRMAAPAAAPGAGEAMSKTPEDTGANMSADVAALHGRLAAQEARMNERDLAEARKDDVADALKRLEGRPLGADLEGKLVSFHKDHGGEAFKAYVDSMSETFGATPQAGDGREAAFLGHASEAPSSALRFQDQGSDVVETAARFSREWQELNAHGATGQSEDRYVEINMARGGVALTKQPVA